MSPRPAARRVEVVAIAVVLDRGEVLVNRRADGVRYAAMDEFPGGRREPGESREECARREVREETGLEVQVRRLLDHRVLELDDVRLELWFYECALCGPRRRPSPDPGEALRWVPTDRLGTLCFPPANAAVLARLTGKGELSGEA